LAMVVSLLGEATVEKLVITPHVADCYLNTNHRGASHLQYIQTDWTEGSCSVTFHCNRYEFIMQYAGGAANSRINNRDSIVEIANILIVSFSLN
jgi:hypothetical protein